MQGVRGDDLKAYYERALGPTESISVGNTSSTRDPKQLALKPGRYLLRIASLAGGATTVWVLMGKFSDGTVTATAAVPCFPLDSAYPSFELNVRKGYNDQIAAITNAGTATLYITQVSAGAG